MEQYTTIQKQIIETTEPHVLVQSSSASGKTRTLVGRLKYLLDQGIPPEEIVAITFTNNAASVMYERLGKPQGLFISTVHSYVNYLLRGNAIDTTNIIREERFDDLFEEIKRNQQCLKHVSFLLVDESMDCSKKQFEFFELVNPDNYMYFFDLRQSIFSFSGAYPEYLINKMHENDVTVFSMSQNFRNYPDILRFAKKFLYRLGPDYEDNSIAMREPTDGCNHHVLEGTYTPSEAVKSLITQKERLDTDWGDWFVICRTNADIQLFQQLFDKEGVPTDTFKQSELTNSQIEDRLKENTIKILTGHSVKGMERKCVLSYNIRAYNDEEARLCYVAATRARDFLIWAKMPPKKKKKKQIVNWE